MKSLFITLAVVLSSPCFASPPYPSDSIANRMEKCEVVSVSGSWAMSNYPRSVEVFYGILTHEKSPSQWDGYVTFGFATSNDSTAPERVKLFPVRITSEQTSTYAGDTAVGTTQPIKFRFEKFDFGKNVGIYKLNYAQGEGIYECQRTWQAGLPH